MSKSSQFTLTQGFMAMTGVALIADVVRRIRYWDYVLVRDDVTPEQFLAGQRTMLVAMIEGATATVLCFAFLSLTLRRWK